MSINRHKLLEILGSPKDISEKDLEELENVVQQYPYFQLAYALIAKSKYDRQTPDAYDSLSVAAVYAPDRSTLKKIFYDNLCIDSQATHPTEDIQTEANTPDGITSEVVGPNQIETEEDNKATAEEQDAITAADQSQVETEETIEAEEDNKAIAEEVSAESEAAPEEEQDAITAADQSQVETGGTDTSKIGEAIEITEAEPEEESMENKEEEDAVYRELEENLKKLRENKLKFDDEEEDKKSSDKKKTINEIALPENEVAKVEILPSDDQKTSVTENFKRSREKGTSRLITEISSLEPLPADHIRTKQQTQFSLIDKFINSEPEIVYKDKGAGEVKVSDLSEKSTLIRDHLLTENFAAIMVKQRRMDKAIEIYRKLIWKFPQKKAYFAARIKALKESE